VEKTMSEEKSFDRKTLEYALAELGQRAFSGRPHRRNRNLRRRGIETNSDIDDIKLLAQSASETAKTP